MVFINKQTNREMVRAWRYAGIQSRRRQTAPFPDEEKPASDIMERAIDQSQLQRVIGFHAYQK